jgi:hypothetical protein
VMTTPRATGSPTAQLEPSSIPRVTRTYAVVCINVFLGWMRWFQACSRPTCRDVGRFTCAAGSRVLWCAVLPRTEAGECRAREARWSRTEHEGRRPRARACGCDRRPGGGGAHAHGAPP